MATLPALAVALLLAAPASAQLSCDKESIADAMTAGLEQFRSSNACGQAVALDWFNKLFKDGLPKDRVKAVLYNGDADPAPYQRAKQAKGAPAPEMTPITADVLDAAVTHVLNQMKGGALTGACVREDESGDWDIEPECSSSLCGKIELSSILLAKVQNSSFANEKELRDADQVGNTLTHELVHMLVSYFRRVYGAHDQPTIDGGLQSDFQYLTFFNGCSLYETNGFQGREHTPIEYIAPTDRYASSNSGNEQAARMIAHGMQRCFNKKLNPFYLRILGSPRLANTCGA